MDIAGRVAIVTGGGHRLGGAIARALARSGADVYLHYHRSFQEAAATAADIATIGRRVVIGSFDLSEAANGPALVDAASEELGPASILVNAASGFADDTFADVTADQLRASLDLSLIAPVLITQAFAAAMPSGLDGAVVNITDAKVATPYRRHFSYILAKGGLDTFTRTAALALAPRIRVNAVAPGMVLPPADVDDGYIDRIAGNVPLPAPGGAATVAGAVLGLITNDFVTGETLRVDGGAHLI